MKKILCGLAMLASFSAFANSAFAKETPVELKVLRLERGVSYHQDDIILRASSDGYYESGSILTHAISTKDDEVKVQCHVTPSMELGVLYFDQDKERIALGFEACKKLSNAVRAEGASNIVVQKVSVGKGKNQYFKWVIVGIAKE
jgi:hypothetical protein